MPEREPCLSVPKLEKLLKEDYPRPIQENIKSIIESSRYGYSDPEFSRMLDLEIISLESQLAEIELYGPTGSIEAIIIEIRAGVGGEESGLFAAELFKMYLTHAQKKKWKIRMIEPACSNIKTAKIIKCKMIGKGVELLTFESGVHRVQRIPKTESKGRKHTSAVSVVVLDIPKDINITISSNDLNFKTCKSSGAGGQHVNTTDSAVKVTHIPTNIQATSHTEKSQHQNKKLAIEALKLKLYTINREKQDKKRSLMRKKHIKSGDRGDKIKTYNFPNNRITDHRSNEKHNLLATMTGKFEKYLEGVKRFVIQQTIYDISKRLSI